MCLIYAIVIMGFMKTQQQGYAYVNYYINYGYLYVKKKFLNL